MKDNYPLFSFTPHYLKVRQGRKLTGAVKRWGERLALDNCLSAASLPATTNVYDIPCGPGRLFPYWQRRGWSVTGVDLSDSMVAAASAVHAELGLAGAVHKGDSFSWRGEMGEEQPDIVACVRFLYYFDADVRIILLKNLAALSKHYLLLQYHTTETLRGRRNAGRNSLRYISDDEIKDEIQSAGLKLLRIRKISNYSDFVYVLAEK